MKVRGYGWGALVAPLSRSRAPAGASGALAAPSLRQLIGAIQTRFRLRPICAGPVPSTRPFRGHDLFAEKRASRSGGVGLLSLRAARVPGGKWPIGVQHGGGSTSSASGFLMCTLITRAIGRAPISSSSAETYELSCPSRVAANCGRASSIHTPSGPRMKHTRTPGRMVVGSRVNSTPLAFRSAAIASMPVTASPK